MKIEKLSDEKALKLFVELLETRVSITTGFVSDEEENATLTHQFITVNCGDFSLTSQPELLETPLRVATGGEIGATVN